LAQTVTPYNFPRFGRIKSAILNMKTPYPQMAQIEQIFNAFSPGSARHIVPTLPLALPARASVRRTPL
jgi:hypothetical protein